MEKEDVDGLGIEGWIIFGKEMRVKRHFSLFQYLFFVTARGGEIGWLGSYLVCKYI